MQEITINHKRDKRTKHLKIKIKNGTTALVTRPWYIPKKTAEHYTQKHTKWIQEECQKQQQKEAAQPWTGTTQEYKKYKEQARHQLSTLATYYAQKYNLNYKRLAIRNQTTRWGSCSSKANLNFSYKIIFLPEYLQHYIVIHEICHLQELNHSERFWKLVEQQCPSHKQHRKELKQYS